MPEPLLTASAMFANAARFSDAYHAVAFAAVRGNRVCRLRRRIFCCFWRIIPDCETAAARSAGCAG